MKMFQDANTGLLLIPKRSLDPDLAARLCDIPLPVPHSLFVEQSILAVLAAEAGFTQLPSDKYVVSNAGMMLWEKDLNYQSVVARHYTGTVRHRLRSKGVPVLKRSLAIGHF